MSFTESWMNIQIDARETLEGLSRTLDNLEDVPNVVQEDMQYFMDYIVFIAQMLVPVDTGNLHDSIRWEGSFPNYRFIADAQNMYGQYYARYVEFGTYKMEAQPFMWPAIYRALREVIPIMRKNLMNAIKGR